MTKFFVTLFFIFCGSAIAGPTTPAAEHKTVEEMEDNVSLLIAEHALSLPPDEQQKLISSLHFRMAVLDVVMDQCDYDLGATRTLRSGPDSKSGLCMATMTCPKRAEGAVQSITFQCPTDPAGKCPVDHSSCAASDLITVVGTSENAVHDRDARIRGLKNTRNVMRKAIKAIETLEAVGGTEEFIDDDGSGAGTQ